MSDLSPLFRHVFACSSADGQDMAAELLRAHYGPAVIRERGQADGWVYAPGSIPLMLVAHTDVIHRRPSPTLYHDAAQGVVWAPEGLGADDRAGVYAVAVLLSRGYRPHVLLTDGEETGGLGARSAALMLDAPDVHLLCELDRQGAADAVHYSHRPTRGLSRYLRRHGYARAEGSYTDICELMPAWGVAGVNLSVGYCRQHTGAEHLRLAELAHTIDAVSRMLDAPPPRQVYRPPPIRALAADDLALGWDAELSAALARDVTRGRCDGCQDYADLGPSPHRSGDYCDDCRAVLAQVAV